MVGKRVTAPADTTCTVSPAGAALIYLKDRRSHIRYLVDTGAAVSLVPHHSPLKASGLNIVNASGFLIPSWQFVSKKLHFGPHEFVHSFLQAAVSQPILGMDFLSTHSLSIDMSSKKVVFPSFPSSAAASPTFSTPPPAVAAVVHPPPCFFDHPACNSHVAQQTPFAHS